MPDHIAHHQGYTHSGDQVWRCLICGYEVQFGRYGFLIVRRGDPQATHQWQAGTLAELAEDQARAGRAARDVRGGGDVRLLDLFCGAGGAAMGYHRAGFTEIVGVDNNPMPRYPFEFVQADALEYLAEHGHEFDVIHASPPCQVYSVLSHLAGPGHEDLVPATRELLVKTGAFYVIENVPGAPLINPFTLCGTGFGLQTQDGAQLRRHRLFETSFDVLLVPPCAHNGRTIGIFGDKARDTGAEKRHYSKAKSKRGQPPDDILFTHDDARQAMGIDWMTIKELSQAIPPAYTEYIGSQLLRVLAQRSAPHDSETGAGRRG